MGNKIPAVLPTVWQDKGRLTANGIVSSYDKYAKRIDPNPKDHASDGLTIFVHPPRILIDNAKIVITDNIVTRIEDLSKLGSFNRRLSDNKNQFARRLLVGMIESIVVLGWIRKLIFLKDL